MKLQLEMNINAIDTTGKINVGSGVILFTPTVGEDYWKYRVRLGNGQSILGFQKFGMIGIGFAKEIDWNTNLPSGCDAEIIYNHIKVNKGSKPITDEDCIEAIKMIQSACKRYENVPQHVRIKK